MTKTLGERIKEARLLKGLTQAELGGAAVTPSMISQIESNKSYPSYKVLHQIAANLGTTAEHLMTDALTTMEVFTLYRIARASILFHNYKFAVAAYQELLKQEFGISKLQLTVEYAECLIALLRPQEGIDHLLKALDSAADEELINHSLMSRFFYMLGLSYLRANSHVLAYHNLQRALLEHSAEYGEDTTFVASIYKTLAETIRHVNLREYEFYLNKALVQYRAFDSEQLAGLYLELAHNHASKADYISSIEYTNRAISAFLRKGNVDECKDSEHLLVMLEYRQNPSDYEKYIKRLLKIADHYKNREAEKRAGLLLDIATIFYEVKKNQNEQAFQYATEVKEKIAEDHLLMGKVSLLLGFIYSDRHERVEAKLHFYKAIDIFKLNDCLRDLQQAVDALLDLLEQEENDKEGVVVARSFYTFLVERLQCARGVIL